PRDTRRETGRVLEFKSFKEFPLLHPPPSRAGEERGGGRDVIRINAKRFERLEQSYLRSLTCAQKRSTFTAKATGSAAFCISRTPIKASLLPESSKGPAFSVLKIQALHYDVRAAL